MKLKKAAVNYMTVKKIESIANAIVDYSSQLQNGLNCIENLYGAILLQIKKIEEVNIKAKKYRNQILEIIDDLKKKIEYITNCINDLNDDINEKKSSLSEMDPTETIYDSEGHSIEVENTEYTSLEDEIKELENEVEDFICAKRTLQDKVNVFRNHEIEINYRMEKNFLLIGMLNDKAQKCNTMKDEFFEIKENSKKTSMYASQRLFNIRSAVDKYIKVKIKSDSYNYAKTNLIRGVNINITVGNTVTNIINKYNTSENIDNKCHVIKYDKEGRICEFDGKKFGGQYNTYEARLDRTPIVSEKGEFTGIRGESKFIPSEKTAYGMKIIKILKKYNLNGIEYRNAEPDFEVCAEAVVTIKNMSENRDNYKLNGIAVYGNFAQADIECARMWNEQKKNGKSDWTARDVEQYRKENNLVWHEKCDTRTMVMVRFEINDFFTHSGGCSECRVRDNNQGDGFDE